MQEGITPAVAPGTDSNVESPTATGQAPAGPNPRLREIDARLAWLELRLKDLAQSRRWLPWLGLLALGAIPAGITWGPFAALALIAIALSIPFGGMYIVWSHEAEYTAERKDLRQQRHAIETHGTVPARQGRPWRVPGKALEM